MYEPFTQDLARKHYRELLEEQRTGIPQEGISYIRGVPRWSLLAGLPKGSRRLITIATFIRFWCTFLLSHLYRTSRVYP